MSLPQEATPLALGERVDGYEIESVLARGRFTFSYAAKALVGGSQVVLNEFLPHEFALRDGSQLRARDLEDRNALRWWMRSFLDRAAQLQAINHPGLVKVLRNFEANGTGYYVTEPTSGETLASLLEREGTLNEAQLRRILASVLGGLDRAHAAGILHRDIRPQNIWLRGDGTAALAEFGILRAPIRFKSKTLATSVNPPYSAPEEYVINGNVGAWSDIYSLGSTAYRVVSGQDPVDARERERGVFLAVTSQVVRVRASDALLNGIDSALHLAPAERPQTIAVWSDMLELSLVGTQAGANAARPVSGALPPINSGATERQAVLLLIPLLLAAGAAAAWYFLKSPSPPPAVVAPVPAVTATLPATTAPPAVATAPPVTTAPAPAADAANAAPSGDLDKLVQELMARDKKAQAELKEQQRLVEQLSKQNAKAGAPGAVTPGATAAATPPTPASKSAKPAAAAPATAAEAAAPAPTPASTPAAASAEAPDSQAEASQRAAALEAEIKRLKAVQDAASKASVQESSSSSLASYRGIINAAIRQNLRYPAEARANGYEGNGAVRVRVRRDGTILGTELVADTGFEPLDTEAVAVFRHIGHLPPMPADLQPEDSEVSFTIPISFKLSR